MATRYVLYETAKTRAMDGIGGALAFGLQSPTVRRALVAAAILDIITESGTASDAQRVVVAHDCARLLANDPEVHGR
jgi:hypothetical protein